MKNQQRAVKVQTSKVVGPNGEVIPTTLDDLVKQIKKAILHKEYVPGSKTYNANYPIVRGYLQSACLCTIELINRGAENGGIDTDKYSLLTATTKSFGTKNSHINEILADLAEERDQDVKDKFELEMDDNPENPISDEQHAKLLAEPTADKDTHVVNITTKDGGEIEVNKQEGKVTVKNTDGTTQTATMSKLETWRKTATAWITAFITHFKSRVSTTVDTITSFLSNLNPFKKAEEGGVFLKIEVDEDGTMYYDPADLPEGSAVPKGAIPRPAI